MQAEADEQQFPDLLPFFRDPFVPGLISSVPAQAGLTFLDRCIFLTLYDKINI